MSRTAGLSREELAAIMLRVDEQLAEAAVGMSRDTPDETAVDLPALDRLDQRVRALRLTDAPLFAVVGWRPPALVRRLLNLPIRLFGYKQRRFNEELVDALGLALDALSEVRQQLERQEREIQALKQRTADSAAPESRARDASPETPRER